MGTGAAPVVGTEVTGAARRPAAREAGLGRGPAAAAKEQAPQTHDRQRVTDPGVPPRRTVIRPRLPVPRDVLGGSPGTSRGPGVQLRRPAAFRAGGVRFLTRAGSFCPALPAPPPSTVDFLGAALPAGTCLATALTGSTGSAGPGGTCLATALTGSTGSAGPGGTCLATASTGPTRSAGA